MKALLLIVMSLGSYGARAESPETLRGAADASFETLSRAQAPQPRAAGNPPWRPETERDYSGVKAFLQALADSQKDRASLFTLGQADSKDAIIGIKIGEGPVRNLLVAAHHGNEYGSAEVALSFAESAVKEPLEGQTIYVVPVLNVSGYNKRQREERDSTGESFDPNRDYPGPCGSEGPFKLKSTNALAQFLAREKIVNAAALHTFYPAVVYPWGFSTRDVTPPYLEIFTEMVRNAAQESRAETGNSTEVIYPANGTFEDYAFWNHGAWAILFELGFSHSPSEEEIQTMAQLNVPGIRRMFLRAPSQPARTHQFTGACDQSLKALDRHDE